MAAVVLFVILCVGLYCLYLYLKKEDKRISEFREYAKSFSDREVGLLRTKKTDSRDSDEIIAKFFKEHPDKLDVAKKIYKEKEERRHYNRESWKKKYILERIFAYDYEDMLFQIYSTNAIEDTRGKWVNSDYVNKEEMICKISDIKNVDSNEAEKILDLLYKHGIICDIGGKYLLSPLLQDFGDDNKWSWNIVSDVDLNLDKWMVAHGYEHKKN